MRTSAATEPYPSKRVLLAIAFCLPGAALLAGALLNTSGPSIALASDPLEDTSAIAPPTMPERAVPEDVSLRSAWLREQASIPNPLYYPPRIEPIVPVEPPRTKPTPVETSAPAPFVVTAMLRNRDGSARAVIDGALFDAGDELAPGWVIIEINPTKRHVSLRKPDGTTLLLPMESSTD